MITSKISAATLHEKTVKQFPSREKLMQRRMSVIQRCWCWQGPPDIQFLYPTSVKRLRIELDDDTRLLQGKDDHLLHGAVSEVLSQNTCCRYLQSKIKSNKIPDNLDLAPKRSSIFQSKLTCTCHVTDGQGFGLWHIQIVILVDKLSWSWPSSEPGWWSSCQVRWAVWCWATCWTTATARRGRPSCRSAQHWRSSRVSIRSN